MKIDIFFLGLRSPLHSIIFYVKHTVHRIYVDKSRQVKISVPIVWIGEQGVLVRKVGIWFPIQSKMLLLC